MTGGVWPNSNTSSSWGGGVVQMGGKWELFVSQIDRHCGLNAWQSNSEIVHGSADTLWGPYTGDPTVVVPVWAHNANPVLIPAGSRFAGHVAVFHVGNGTNGKGSEVTDCVNGSTPPSTLQQQLSSNAGCKPEDFREPIPVSKSITTSHATSARGPWWREIQTCVGPALNDSVPFGCPHFSNAAPIILANGTTLLLHSGCPGAQGHGFNVAVAPSWVGPYRPARGVDHATGQNAWYNFSIDTRAAGGCTDPFGWVDPRGRYHALFHCHWPGGVGDRGGHAFSDDGVTWTTSAVQPWGVVVPLTDGSNVTYGARQRPHLVLDPATAVPGISPSGSPIALVVGTKAYTKDPAAQLPWMTRCTSWGDPFCDKVFTQMQPIQAS